MYTVKMMRQKWLKAESSWALSLEVFQGQMNPKNGLLSGALHKRTEQKQIRDKVSQNTHFEGYLKHLLQPSPDLM